MADLKFDSDKYKKIKGSYYEITDAYANNIETYLSFYHVPSGKEVYFKAFITSFNETFNCDWASEAVFGRVDPIQTFKQNERSISLAFDVPAATESEAYSNLGSVQKLLQFLYPTYSNINQSNTLTQSPLVRLKVMNLLRPAPEAATNPVEAASGLFNDYNSGGSNAENGILGIIKNITVNHNLERPDGVIEHSANTILPKLLTVNLSFTVIHETPLGWSDADESEFADNALFPYGVELFDMDKYVAANLESSNAGMESFDTEADAQFDEFGNPIVPETNSNAGGTDSTVAEEEASADAQSLLQQQ